MDNRSEVPSASTLPTWQHFMKPILEILSDGAVWSKRPLTQAALDRIGATDVQRAEVLPSGQLRGQNRAGWAMSFLVRADAIRKPARATFAITETGRALLAEGEDVITERRLKQIPAWHEYTPARSSAQGEHASGVVSDETDPLEAIESGIARFETEVESELVRRLQDEDPAFFEQAVVDLLIAMGYGGAEQNVRRLGGSGDGGVDGVIDQDALGLNRVYVQAKRYADSNTVHRPALQAFVGALADKGATQGLFVTTSQFSQGVKEYVERIPSRVVLVDGSRLAELMVKYRVGVQVRHTYDLLEIDENYFE